MAAGTRGRSGSAKLSSHRDGDAGVGVCQEAGHVGPAGQRRVLRDAVRDQHRQPQQQPVGAGSITHLQVCDLQRVKCV